MSEGMSCLYLCEAVISPIPPSWLTFRQTLSVTSWLTNVLVGMSGHLVGDLIVLNQPPYHLSPDVG